MPMIYLLCFLGFWSWLTIVIYKLHLKHKEVYYKHKEEIKKEKEEAAKIKWVDVSFDLINVDSKVAQKILKTEEKNLDLDYDKMHYFDYTLEPYGDNKFKVVADDNLIVGDIQEKDIEEAKNIGYIKDVKISKKLDNEGKYIYYATAITNKKE